MAYSLVLFDYDGMTDIVHTHRLGKDMKPSLTCTFKYGGRKHLAEVLEVSGKFAP